MMAEFQYLQGEIIQRILHIYLEHNESPLCALTELACSILPQVNEVAFNYCGWVVDAFFAVPKDYMHLGSF